MKRFNLFSLLSFGLWSAMAMAYALVALAFIVPLDMSRYKTVSTEIMDRKGEPLRIYLAGDGVVRLKAEAEEVDKRYLNMLVAYEDKRFYEHNGIDPRALVRALAQALSNGRIVSGGSTLTMQTARLLEPRPRTLSAKLIEMFRARQLEMRYSKDDILSIYLTLAPFGGNIEGVRAASLHYFGQVPDKLTMGEAALLVALPQAPSRIRPDRAPEKAREARNKVLDRVAAEIKLDEEALALAKREPVSNEARPFPFTAPLLGDRMKRERTGVSRFHTTIDRSIQLQLENLVSNLAASLEPEMSIALLVVENKTREVRAYIGSADFHNEQISGQVDLVRALRSPGSALKPVFYGMAFDRGLGHPSTMINDVQRQFGQYAPSNFMDRHYGEVTLASALQKSLNVPAVEVLQSLGSNFVVERLRRDGIRLEFGAPGARPGLAFALGGVGTRLEDLVRIYAAIADDGHLRLLQFEEGAKVPFKGEAFLDIGARYYLQQILQGVRPPEQLLSARHLAAARGIAFKTGTSYGFRDAWAIGFTPDMTIGVWVGRADGTPSPGHFGANTAAPILFKAFERVPRPKGRFMKRPADILPIEVQNLPPGQRYWGENTVQVALGHKVPPPRIKYPLNDTILAMPPEGRGVVLEGEGGAGPLHWVVNGRPIPSRENGRKAQWVPDGPGFSEIALIDAEGRTASIHVRFIESE